jgi:hypothetical protein
MVIGSGEAEDWLLPARAMPEMVDLFVSNGALNKHFWC